MKKVTLKNYNMYSNLFTGFLLLILVYSCSNTHEKNVKTIELSDFGNCDTLKSELVGEYALGSVAGLFYFDSLLVVHNLSREATHAFTVFSLSTGQITDSLLRRGKGPNECVGDFYSRLEVNQLWVYDFALKQILTLPIEELHRKGEKVFRRFKTIDFSSVSFLDTLNYVGCGSMLSLPKIQYMSKASDSIQSEIGTYEQLPKDIERELYAFKVSAHRSHIFTNPATKQIALAHFRLDRVEIFSPGKAETLIISGPYHHKLEYKASTLPDGRTYYETQPYEKRGFVHGYTTAEYIVLLYSGINATSENDHLAKELFVYKWDGSPVKRFVLDRSTYVYTFSPDLKMLYTFDEETGVIRKAKIDW